MKRRFIVVTSTRATEEQHKALEDHVKNIGYGWWHWFSNVWLLSVGSHRETDASSIRDEMATYYGGLRLLVIQMPDDPNTDGWAGLDDTDRQNMFRWFENNWE